MNHVGKSFEFIPGVCLFFGALGCVIIYWIERREIKCYQEIFGIIILTIGSNALVEKCLRIKWIAIKKVQWKLYLAEKSVTALACPLKRYFRYFKRTYVLNIKKVDQIFCWVSFKSRFSAKSVSAKSSLHCIYTNLLWTGKNIADFSFFFWEQKI